MEFIDLELPSGTKWANMNIGATSEIDYGLYFQWGDTVGYTGDEAKAHSKWQTCPGNGGNSSYNSTSLSAWDSTNLTNGVLNTNVDAAYVHTEGKAKMPTLTQCQELLNETNHSWVTNYNGTGINGMKFVSKGDSSKCIFIPASGYAWDGSFYDVGNYGGLWASSVNASLAQFAFSLYFDSSYCGVSNFSRYFGRCVRGILG